MTISRSQMTKQMESPMDKFKPMKEADYEKLTPAQKKAYDAKAKKAMMGNLPNAADKARQDALDKEFGTYNRMPDGEDSKAKKANDKAKAKKMMAGGMAKMKSGGKLPMVEKGGKKVPFYAADGKGKMMAGGKVDKPKRGQRAAKNKMMAGGMAKSKIRGYGMARGGKVCKMR